jgi:hypothetical protein
MQRTLPGGRPSPASRWTVGIAAGTAAVWALAGGRWLFPLLTDDGDEGAYLAQADALSHGRIGPPVPHDLVAAFQPWLSAARDGTYVFKYAPPHAALLALGDLVGDPRVAIAIAAAVCVVLVGLLARELGGTRTDAWLASLILLASPLFIVQSATLLPYVPNLALLLGLSVSTIRAFRRDSAWTALAAGTLLGIALWSRPFDAVLVAVPLGVYAVIDARRRGSRVARLLVMVAVGAAPWAVAVVVYNAVAVGDAFRLPFQLITTDDTLGFGPRRLDVIAPFFDYTVPRALRAAVENLRLVVTFACGSLLLVALAALGCIRWPDRRARWWLLAGMAVWVVGYFFFWGSYSSIFSWDGGRFLGPFYYLPLLIPLAIFGARGLRELTRRSRALAVVAVVGGIALSVPVAVQALDSNHRRTEKRTSVEAQVARTIGRLAGDAPALVFVEPVQGPAVGNPFSFWRNGADTSRTLYAVDRGAQNVDVARRFPRRPVFEVAFPDGYPSGDSATSVRTVVRASTVEAGRSLHIRPAASTDGTGAWVMEAELDGERATAGADGVVLRADGSRLLVTDTVTLRSPRAAGTLQLRAPPAAGSSARSLEVPFRVDDGSVAVLWPATAWPSWSLTADG